VTVAQALHWFDRERFYEHVRRVGRAGSVLAAWSYGLASIEPAVDRIVRHFYSNVVGPYWPPERKLTAERYETISFPFGEIPPPRFAMAAAWRLDDLIGYLGTWSSVQRFVEARGRDPLVEIQADLSAAWGSLETMRTVTWPLYLRVGRID
jgi:hypothetical protein